MMPFCLLVGLAWFWFSSVMSFGNATSLCGYTSWLFLADIMSGIVMLATLPIVDVIELSLIWLFDTR